MKKEPMLVMNPNTGLLVDVSGIFQLLKSHNTFPEVGELVQKEVIRFINESCVIDDDTGKESQNMFFLLYLIADAFKSMEEVKSCN